jgi:alginate O-acetyltransferase complex protein AlgJ
MLRGYSRYWPLFMAALLLAPVIAQFSRVTNTLSPDENRALASLPGFPRTFKDLTGWPGRLDAYLRDRFGFRNAIIRAHTWITQATFSQGGNAQVLLGNGGWMFYRGDHMLEQSSGRIMRTESIARTVGILADIEAILTARGGKLVVASPPNSATIYFDKINGWPRESVGATEYDVQLRLLIRRNIKAVDLRPILRAERAQADTYRQHDTHWNARGALAAFNAIAAEAGFADWRIDPVKAIGPEVLVAGGDLARMLGIANYVSELDRPLKLPEFKKVDYSAEPVVYEMTPGVHRGPTILILGDSFTVHHFAPMIAANGARAVWVHHQNCGFDWKWIEKFQPDQIWYLPTERYFACDPRRRPRGMPATAAASVGGPSSRPPKL